MPKRKLQTYACSACGKLCEGERSWEIHLGKSQYCSAVDAEPVRCDLEAERTAELQQQVQDAAYAAEMKYFLMDKCAEPCPSPSLIAQSPAPPRRVCIHPIPCCSQVCNPSLR